MQNASPIDSSSTRPSVAIIGGGVIGLALGWRLASTGCPVTLVERNGETGRGASWAAAGMLAAGIEAEPTEEALFQLARWSQALWPGFAAELEAAAGLPVGYDTTGTLVCAFTRDQAEKLRHGIQFQRSLGGVFEWLGAAAAREREPGLAPSLVAAAFSPNDHQVDNRLLATALTQAFRRAGGRLVTGVEASVDMAGGRAVGIVAGEARHAADVTVVAAGAWSRMVPGLPAAVRPPTRPVKGQMLALRMPPAAPLVRHVVWGGHCYLVPRADGRLLVGATVEERGFDAEITAGGLLGLLDDAWRTLPAIEDLPVHETWAGFRPGSPDDQPILGPTGIDGLLVATGHHRNGILLTPATAEAMTELILIGRTSDRIRPFGLDRFEKEPRP
ncbi:glycine oxidase ThiO [Aliidongia dinghuensis]|uniref:Glycine oxidase ThiO n=1 Tax=Aliidongia dinghuensis TaxID=1867774 RepID=A0A8J3E3F9_9PROT|nr:glycine oxidase ThiO [Aliidongia dinghuensis]GGF06293.1 glycine oxidase ThiO [Aliidongia dinghuensis]